MSKATVTRVRISQIKVDGDSQPRSGLNADCVETYAADMKDGDVFPPVDAVFDGENYWLWDGFHRLAAAKKNAQATIQARIVKGDVNEARWLSCTANRAQGLYRSNDDKAVVVRRALAHPKAVGLSNRLIAEHCGVSEHAVRLHRQQAESGATKSHLPPGRKVMGRDEKSYPSQAPPDSSIPDDGPPMEGVKKKGASTKAKAPTDGLGQLLPDSVGIREAFARAGEIDAMMDAISKIRCAVQKAVDAKDPLFAGLNESQFMADCQNAYGALKAAAPYAVCPYCAGDGCKACYGRGWLGQFAYQRAPREMKTGRHE